MIFRYVVYLLDISKLSTLKLTTRHDVDYYRYRHDISIKSIYRPITSHRGVRKWRWSCDV